MDELPWVLTTLHPRQGHCAYTTRGENVRCPKTRDATFGNWPLEPEEGRVGYLGLQQCIAMCALCQQCGYVSHAFKDNDCSWFSSCNRSHFDRLTEHITYLIRDGNRLLATAEVLRVLQVVGAAAATSTSWQQRVPLWSPVRHTSFEFVPSVYQEWGTYNSRKYQLEANVTVGGFASPPPWVPYLFPNTTIYQRLAPRDHNFVPNVGLEATTFLHHVVNHYHDLAGLTLVAQADLPLVRRNSNPGLPRAIPDSRPTFESLVRKAEAAGLHCLRPNASWAPVSSSLVPRYFQRDDCSWRGWSIRNATSLRCFKQFARFFGVRWPEVGCPNFYIASAFAVSAAMIRRFPLDVWVRAYQHALSQPQCQTDGTGGERSAHAVFGGHAVSMKAWDNARWCEQYLPDCAYSPCKR